MKYFKVYYGRTLVLNNVGARIVSQQCGIGYQKVYEYAKTGEQTRGGYYIREGISPKEAETMEARRVFGSRNYEDWERMNQRYGTRWK